MRAKSYSLVYASAARTGGDYTTRMHTPPPRAPWQDVAWVYSGTHIQYIHIRPSSRQMCLFVALWCLISRIHLVSRSPWHTQTYRLPSHKSPPTHTHTHTNIWTYTLLGSPLCLYSGLSGVVDSVVNTLWAPEWIGVVKLEQVNAAPGVLVAASVHLLMTVPPVHRHNLIHLGLPCLLLCLLLLTRRLTYGHKNTWSYGKQEERSPSIPLVMSCLNNVIIKINNIELYLCCASLLLT